MPSISGDPKCLSVLAGSQTLCTAGDVLQGPAPWDGSQVVVSGRGAIDFSSFKALGHHWAAEDGKWEGGGL